LKAHPPGGHIGMGSPPAPIGWLWETLAVAITAPKIMVPINKRNDFFISSPLTTNRQLAPFLVLLTYLRKYQQVDIFPTDFSAKRPFGNSEDHGPWEATRKQFSLTIPFREASKSGLWNERLNCSVK
jgi:hypothetical protein